MNTRLRPRVWPVVIVGLLLLSGQPPRPVHAQTAGLVAAYNFNEGAGSTFADASGNNNAGTLTGATWAAGKTGTALSFNGTSAYATVPDAGLLDLTNAMTLEAWVYPITLGAGWRTIVLKEQPGQLTYAMYANTDANAPSGDISTSAGDAAVAGAAQLPLNTWTHLAATYDSANLRIYVNGTLIGSRAATGAILTSANPLRIGGNLIWGEYFNGRVDDLRIYSRSLSVTEIQQDMNQPVVPVDTTPPTVTSTNPASAATNVPTGTDVSAVFSKDMDPQTITTTTVVLRDSSGTVVPGTVAYDGIARRATLTPTSRLAPSASYSARVLGGAGGVKDLGGRAMAADVAWTFTTTSDVSTPVVVSRSPSPGSTSAASTVSVLATFSEAMQANSIAFVLQTATGSTVPATVSYDNTTFTATLRPNAALASSTPYTAIVQNASDLAGNPISGPVSWTFSTGAAGFEESIVFSGLVEPTAIEFASDGRVFVAEKSGLIKVFSSLTAPTPTIFADLRTNVHNFWDRGLLGLALDPQFPARPYVYVAYTYDAAIGGTAPRWGTVNGTSDPCPNPPGATVNGCVVSGRLSRLTASGNVQSGPELVLIEDWADQFPSHSIGTIAFGIDGYLYMSGGEGASFNDVDYGQFGNPFGDPPSPAGTNLTPPTAEGGALRSQDLRTLSDPVNLHGTIIRVDPDTGAGAPDNPLATSPDVNARRIIAHGLRNPFRFTFRPGTRELFIGDVGWNTWEEINRIDDTAVPPVRNFGWPCYEGVGRQPGYEALNLNLCKNLYNQAGAVIDPFFAYDHSAQIVPGEQCPTGSSSITGLAFYNGGNYPQAYQGALFFADYSRNCIWVMFADSPGIDPNPARIATFRPAAAGPVQLKIGPAGDLFYVDLNGTVRRIRYFDGNRPPHASAVAAPTAGGVPLTVSFDGSASSDPDVGDSLTYAWDLDGDGFFNDGNTPTVSFTYTSAGTFTARLRVTDSQGLFDIQSMTITTNGVAPVATIQSPASSLTWAVGDVISFSGSATDQEDGTLPPSAFSWSIIMHHCSTEGSCHTHLIQTLTGISQGSFTAPDHEYPSYLELTLTATDSSGLSDTKSVRLDPKTTVLTLDSVPSGLTIGAGSSAAATPFTKTVILGGSISLSAPSPQTLGAAGYEFGSWSDGGAQTHAVVAAGTAATYRATYAAVPSLSISNATATEKDTTSAPLTFTVTLSAASTQTVTVGYATADGTAVAGADYTAAAGTLTFAPGTTTQSIVVQALGDTIHEANETFTVTLSNPAHAGLAAATGTGTIVDNDPAGAPGLVAAYGFNEGSGTAVADQSTNNNAGVVSGAAWVDGKAGKALSFNGTNALVTINDSTSLRLTGGMTLEAWVNPRMGGGWRTILMKEKAPTLSYAMYANTDSNQPSLELTLAAATELRGTSTVPLNVWTYLAATYDGAQLRLYVNGVQVSSLTAAGTIMTSTNPLRIGGNSIWGEYFDGIIDEVRVYNRALTQSEIQTDMTTAVGGGPLPDSTPPVRSGGQPSGTLPSGTTSTTLQLTTDEPATCRYSLTAGTAYAAMTNTFATTGGTSHATPVSGLTDGSTYTYYVRCIDAAGNANTTDGAISFSIATSSTAGLVAAYGFNEGTGSIVNDGSGNGNQGTIANATWSTAGKYGGALLFNGTNAAVAIPDAASLHLTTGMTLEAWVQPTAAQGTVWRTIMLKERPGGLSYALYANTSAGRPSADINIGSDQSAAGTAGLAVNAWTHVAATYDGATLRLYVNGTLVRSVAAAGSLVAATGSLRFGGNSIWSEWFKGYIDEVRIYNRPLSATEIVNDMNKPLVP